MIGKDDSSLNFERDFLIKLLFNVDLPILIFSEDKKIIFANKRSLDLLKIKNENLAQFPLEIGSNRIKEHFYFFTTNIKFFDSENQKEIELPMNVTAFEYIKKIYYLGTIYEGFYDYLTGFPILSIFEENLEKIIVSSKRRNKIFAILFIDIDKFKHINDTYGHMVGDAIIQKTAKILESCLRADDLITRKGGDEFIILLNDLASKEDVHYVIDKIFSFFQKPMFVENQTIPISLSIGISIFPDDAEDSKKLIEKADYAMYKSKEVNQNSFSFYSEKLEKELKEKHKIEKQFLEDYKSNFKNFEVAFQPIFSRVDVNKFSVQALETFVKWNDLQRDIQNLNTESLMEIATKKNIIEEIDRYVLSKVVHFVKNYEALSLPLFVHISTQMFYNDNFVSFLKDTFKKNGVSPKILVLEIKEKTLNKNISKSIEILRELKENHFSICVDDFGRETNLFLINQIKPDYIKIQLLNFLFADLRLFSEVVDSLYFSLKTKIIVSKLESLEMLQEILKSKRVHYFQGFYFSDLLSFKEVLLYLDKGILYEFQ
ncbi:MAG: diguanylate cyclase domain-containing protein [Leptonema sp. (in: bacteria)]